MLIGSRPDCKIEKRFITMKLRNFLYLNTKVVEDYVLMDKNIYPICIDTATQAFIFHPKVYLAQNQISATLITGSANLTSGGLIKNIEASLIVSLDLSTPEDIALISKVIGDFSVLQNQHPQNVFQLRDTSNLDEMVQQGLLVDETLQIQRVNAQGQSQHGRTEQRPCMKTHVRKLAAVRRTKAQTAANVTIPLSGTSIPTIINNKLPQLMATHMTKSRRRLLRVVKMLLVPKAVCLPLVEAVHTPKKKKKKSNVLLKLVTQQSLTRCISTYNQMTTMD